MINILLVSIVTVFSFYFSFSEYGFSQSTGNAPVANPQGGEQPAVIQGESEPPWFYYWPDENLDPFGLSTLGNEGGSTLGKSTERRSNLQVNPPMQEQILDDENVDDVPSDIPVEDTLSSQESISIGGAPSTPAKKGPMYKWVDDNGVIQVTNDLGSVPPKYLDKITTDNQ